MSDQDIAEAIATLKAPFLHAAEVAVDWLDHYLGRIRCRVLRTHNRSCRGRRDHRPDVGRWR